VIDTILFDAEGVVVDSEPIWDEEQEEFLRRRGVPYDRERVKHLMSGKSLADGVKIMQREYRVTGDAAALARERMEIVEGLFERDVQFVKGFPEFFARVRGRYKTCIATALNEDLLRIVDRRLGLKDLFDGHIFTIAQVQHRSKPDPAIFEFAARQLGSRPEQCVVIEDAPLGVEAAKRARMTSIALTTTYSRAKLGGADFIVGSFGEVEGILRQRRRAAKPPRAQEA
jgi:beta-phosphoglucomutase-like phosphatase (HAD superfamily)